MKLSECSSEQSTSAATKAAPVVFIVDDDVSVRESLELLIRSAGWRTKTSASAEDFLTRGRPTAPSCLVLDVTLPGLNGLDLQGMLADWREMPIIFISGFGDIPTTVRAMKAGAVEFLTKPFSDDIVLNAIQQALERSCIALSRQAQMRRLEERYSSLSPRERQVMGLVVSGRLNKEVGGSLGISEITVKAHRGKVMRKMEAQSLAELVNIAAKLGLATALSN
jgi:FixJ family two-component response regulator